MADRSGQYSRRKSRAKPPDPELVMQREKAVQVLLANPELSLRRCKEDFDLKLSIQSLSKYRKRLKEGKEPWLTGPNGGGDGGPKRKPRDTSVEAGAARVGGEVARGLAEVAGVEVEKATTVPAPGAAQGAPPNDDATFSQPGQASIGDKTPSTLKKQAATARSNALQKLNLQMAQIGSQALDELGKMLRDPDRVKQIRSKDLAVIASISVDRFLTTAASIEAFDGSSGVPGVLDHFDENEKSYQDRRVRGEAELKRILKVVKWRDRGHNAEAQSETADGQEPEEAPSEGKG